MEKRVRRVLEQAGHQVHRNGWPDFACTLTDGRRVFVEVKSGVDKLREEQVAAMNWLSDAGFECFVAGFTHRLDGLHKFEKGRLTLVEWQMIGIDGTVFERDPEPDAWQTNRISPRSQFDCRARLPAREGATP